MRWLLAFVGFNALLFAVVLVALWVFGGFADEVLGGEGWIAMALGILFTSAIGVALMALVFFSARKNYDDDAYRAGRPEP